MKTFFIIILMIGIIACINALIVVNDELQQIKSQLQEIKDKHSRIEEHIRATCPHKMPDSLVSEIADHIDYWHMHSPFELSYIQAIIDQESECWPEAVGASGELGLMQLHPCNHPSKDWRISLAQSMEFLKERYAVANGDLQKTLIFYNGGDNLFYSGTEAIKAATGYSRAVMWRYAKIKAEYGEVN